MDDIAVEALAALQTALGGLMTAPVPAGLSRSVQVLPQRIRPTGLGGYVGQHADPTAGLFGRRLDARVEVSVGGNAAAASSYAASLVGEVLAHSRAELSGSGFQRLRGVPADAPTQLRFEVEFEYIRVPEAGEGLITNLDLGLFANVTPYRARPRADFDAAALAVLPVPLADFVARDDPDLDGGSPPGEWAFEAAPVPRIVQRRGAAGGPAALADARKAGTQLLWRPRGAALSLARAVLQFDFASGGSAGLGAVFGRRADDDFWFFLARQSPRYHLFGRRTPLGWTTLAASTAAGFTPGARQRLTIGWHDTTLFAELDGDRTLGVAAAEKVAAGEVGLLTHGNDTAGFFAGRLLELV